MPMWLTSKFTLVLYNKKYIYILLSAENERNCIEVMPSSNLGAVQGLSRLLLKSLRYLRPTGGLTRLLINFRREKNKHNLKL